LEFQIVSINNRPANAFDLIVSLPILRSSLRLCDCNGKFHDLYACRQSYLLTISF